MPASESLVFLLRVSHRSPPGTPPPAARSPTCLSHAAPYPAPRLRHLPSLPAGPPMTHSVVLPPPLRQTAAARRPPPGPTHGPAPGAPTGHQKARWNEKINVNRNNKGHRAAQAPAISVSLLVSFSRLVVTLPDKGCAQRPAGPVSALGAGPPAECTVPRPRRVTAQRPSSCQTWSLPPPPPREEIRRRPNAVPRCRPTRRRRLPPGPAPLAGLRRLPSPRSPPCLPGSPPARSPSRPSPVLYAPRSRPYCLSASLSLSFLSLPAHAAWCASDRRQRRAARRLRAHCAQRRRSGSRRLGHLAGAAGSAAMARPTLPAPLSSQTPRPGGSFLSLSLSRPCPAAVPLRAPVCARGAAPPVTPRPSPAALPQPGAHTKRRSGIKGRGRVRLLLPSPSAPTRVPSTHPPPPALKTRPPIPALVKVCVCGGVFYH